MREFLKGSNGRVANDVYLRQLPFVPSSAGMLSALGAALKVKHLEWFITGLSTLPI